MFIEPKGGGKGYRPDMPSIGQAHGVHGWHSCLNGREVILSNWARGSRHARKGGGLAFKDGEKADKARL